jgi:hypothetical protein
MELLTLSESMLQCLRSSLTSLLEEKAAISSLVSQVRFGIVES